MYTEQIERYGIKNFGFDTHARVLGMSIEEAKEYWNSNYGTFKRLPRTEIWFEEVPELSKGRKKMYRMRCHRGYIPLHITPTAVILTPDGFLTDKGSVPHRLHGIISPDDKDMLFAYLIHDVECEMQRMSRFLTDSMILEVGGIMGASWLKRNVSYTAVRFGNRFGKGDKIINGFNVTRHNQELVRKAEQEYFNSDKFKELC